MSAETEFAHDTGLDEIAQGLDALLHRAAVCPIDTGWLRVTGEDRVRWLNGMLTNAIQALQPGEGCYNFALNAQGRIQADANVFLREDCLLIESAHAAELMGLLDHYIIMDDVELTLLPAETRAGLLVAGPDAAEALERLGLAAPAGELNLLSVDWNGAAVEVLRAHAPLVPRVELWAEPAICAQLRERLALPEAGAEALEALRLLEGTPRYGTDIREKELPQETGQTRALHFSKGCYLGQEIVERIRSRGNVHRTFAGFTLAGELPVAGASLFAGSAAADPAARPIGELTSVGRVPLQHGTVQLALGYVRREALDRGEAMIYRAADGAVAGYATPAPLPHRIS